MSHEPSHRPTFTPSSPLYPIPAVSRAMIVSGGSGTGVAAESTPTGVSCSTSRAGS